MILSAVFIILTQDDQDKYSFTKPGWNDINDADSSLSSDEEEFERAVSKQSEKDKREPALENKLKNACKNKMTQVIN